MKILVDCASSVIAGRVRRSLHVALATAVAIAAIGATGPVFALDAGRSLTQAFHRIWQVPQGLPQATIYAIRQTDDGYLWLGAPAGLMRFDGVRFTTIRDCAGVPAEKMWIHDFCEDAEGNSWIGTDGMGLIRLRGAVPARYTRAEGLPSDVVQCVLSDQHDAIWAGTPNGLARIAKDVTVYQQELGQASDVRALCEAPDGTIWIGGNGPRLFAFDGTTFHVHELTSLSPGESVRALLAADDGTIFVGTSAGLICLKDDQAVRLTTSDGLAHDSVLCLARGQHGNIWIGTRDGFSRWHAGELDSFTAADGLSQSTVYALWEDREGSLWVGTKHGLNQFSDRRTVPFTVREGLPSNNVGPVCEDGQGMIWVGTLGAGLARFDKRRFATLAAPNGLPNETILSLASGGGDLLWVGTDCGLCRLRDGVVEQTFTTEEGLPSDVIKCLCVSPQGNLWAGTAAGIAELVGDRFIQPAGKADDLRRPVRAMFMRQNGELVIAIDDGGLFYCLDRHFLPFPNAALQQRNVDAFYEDADGRLWMGTPGTGLLMVDRDRTFNFTMKDGLYDDDVIGLVADNKDRLWMASSNGMSYANRTDLVKFAAGELNKFTSTPLRLTDAMRTYEAREGVQPGMYTARDGTIWTSTTRGVVATNVSRLIRVLPPTPVVVEQVIVNGRERTPAEALKLPPGSTNLEFDYTALSLLAPMRITFRYKLEGFDDDWVEAGSRREAFYTNLAPGQYRFRVAARNIDENDWQAARPIVMTIEPHFYQTRWFLPCCALALGLAGWGAYRLRVRGIKDQMRAVVAERGRIARELHDTLMQGFSGVTMEMQALAARLEPSAERGTLDEIIRDAATCLRDARRSVAGLRHAPGVESGLAAALDQTARQLTETRDVRLKLNLQKGPARLPVDVEYNLLRIAQEAIANAVKHSAARSIEVTLAVAANQLRLTVEDDGLGFANGSPETRSGHYGLIGMKERATQIGAAFRIDTEPGRGTAVCVELPMPKAADEPAPPATAPAPRSISVDS